MTTDCTYRAEDTLFAGTASDIMGTRLEMVFTGLTERKSYHLWEAVTARIAALEKVFNRFSPDSEVSRLNALGCSLSEILARTDLSEDMAGALRLSEGYRILTGGLFDITRGGKPDLDFGGFAKGYALRMARVLVRKAGVKNAWMNFGGSTITGIGSHPCGDCWKVGVVNPYSGAVVAEVELRDKTLSTSGDTPGYVGHIINPLEGTAHTGRILSTAVCDDPLDAEVLSTANILADEVQREKIRANFPDAVLTTYDI